MICGRSVVPFGHICSPRGTAKGNQLSKARPPGHVWRNASENPENQTLQILQNRAPCTREHRLHCDAMCQKWCLNNILLSSSWIRRASIFDSLGRLAEDMLCGPTKRQPRDSPRGPEARQQEKVPVHYGGSGGVRVLCIQDFNYIEIYNFICIYIYIYVYLHA